MLAPYYFLKPTAHDVPPQMQNILAMAKDKLKFANVKSQFAPVGDIPVFSLLFVFNVDVCILTPLSVSFKLSTLILSILGNG
jgi:hypothetical protein